MLGFSSSTTCHNYPTILHNESPEEIAQLKTYRSDAGSALDEGRAALASAMTTGGTGSSMTSTLASTAVKTGTLTFWSYLAFQEYLAVLGEQIENDVRCWMSFGQFRNATGSGMEAQLQFVE